MTNHYFNFNDSPVGCIIAEFLASNVDPTPADWKVLISKHPEFVAEIADVAVLRGNARHIEEPAADAPLNRAAFDATVSRAISLLYEVPSAQLADLEVKVAAVRGPGVRKLAQEIGLAPYAALVSGVLAGTIEAPGKLLERLAEKFDTSTVALVEFLRRSFVAARVPSFKSEDGKPEVALRATTWVEAVRAMKLPKDETAKLLNLAD